MWRYNLLILVLTPIIVCYTIFRAIKFKDKRYLIERLSLSLATKFQQKKPVWIHAASVGEVVAIIPLVQRIQDLYPDTPILITTNTTTGAEIVEKQLSTHPLVHHFYMPIDWLWAVQKTIKVLQPRCIFIVETEIWPNLYYSCSKNNIPVIIINARLSHRTTSAKPWLLTIYQTTLEYVTQILARSEEDFESYLNLGAQKSKLKLIGNIKFALTGTEKLRSIAIERPYVLAASTHDNEEIQLVSIWMKLIENKIVSDEILIIVPRHPDRASVIAQQIKTLDATIAIRSNKDSITDSIQVYIADTVGELKQFMLDAKFIFMGGSLIPHGGQNILEPAQLAKAIIFGQHMFNFKNESQLLLDNNAAIQVNNSDELYQQFSELLQNYSRIKQLSTAALTVMQNQENTILERYMTELKGYITN